MSPFKQPKGGILLSSYLISFKGKDVYRYLNGQITNNLDLVTQKNAIYTAITDAKAGMQADGWVNKLELDQWVISAPPVLNPSLIERFERYLIADQVELRDISEEWKLIHWIGKVPKEFFKMALHQKNCKRFGLEGIDLWFSVDSPIPSIPIKYSIDQKLLDYWRIRTKTPRWGNELVAKTLPLEANLEESAISYTKGCYIGQEILSRMKRAQKTSKKLVLVLVSSKEAKLDSALLDQDKKVVGKLTSLASIPENNGNFLGLAYLKTSCLFSEFSIDSVEKTDCLITAHLTERDNEITQF